jgi:hypothetical protein
MTPKRWFWSLLVASAGWSALGHRSGGDGGAAGGAGAAGGGPPLAKRMQDKLVEPVRLVLVPAEFVFGGIEGAAAYAINRVTTKRDATVSVDDLQDENRNLRAELARLNGRLDEALVRLGGLRRIVSSGLTAEDVLPANVLAGQAGAGAGLLHLDKGAMDGVRVGMAVVAPLEQVTVLGRVVAAGQKECEVRLLSDPQMKVRADLVRNSTTPITTDPCLVEGMGAAGMRCQNVNVQPVNPPLRGDFVRLTDPDWPANVRFMLIGQIDEVGTRDNQALRYDLKISPMRPVTMLRTVMVVTKLPAE